MARRTAMKGQCGEWKSGSVEATATTFALASPAQGKFRMTGVCLSLSICAPAFFGADAANAKVFRDVADFVAVAAARFIAFGSADQDNRVIPGGWAPVDEPLGPAGFSTALFTYRMQFDDVIGEGEKPGHEAERLPAKVLVQAGRDHVDSAVRQSLAQRNHGLVKELDLLDSDDMRPGIQPGLQFRRIGHRKGVKVDAVVRADERRVT